MKGHGAQPKGESGRGTPTVWPRVIIHVDMDAFYASVEVLDNPDLAGLPVVVGGTPGGRGVVAAASYAARQFGVHSAMSAAKARQLCPRAVFIRPRMERYSAVSQTIFTIFADFTPLVEPLSIDEAFLDVTGCNRLYGSAREIGRIIKERIATEVGLVASVGIGPNKFLAKLASDLEKPDGFVVIAPEDAPALLRKLPVERMWGVGHAAAKELHLYGVQTIGDLLVIPPEVLAAKFGSHARRWLALGRGEDDRPVVPSREAKSIGNETTFPGDITARDQLREICDMLADKVGYRLRAQEVLAGTITLKARYADFTTHTRSATLSEPTDSSMEIRATVQDLLENKLGRRGRALRLVGVTASNLAAARARQADLFGASEAAERHRRLDRVMDRVQQRYGAKLSRGPLADLDSDDQKSNGHK